MTSAKIISKIKETRERYLAEAGFARRRLSHNLSNLTGQQIQQENIFIQDMESRAYSLFLLLEEIEDEDE